LVKTSRHLEEERSLFLFVLGLIEDLPKVLSQKRISLGMTQKELAEKLGIKEQMVQRYESNGYESISYHRLTKV
jgi:HTH-type transcriptional regulator / antitoxin HipB